MLDKILSGLFSRPPAYRRAPKANLDGGAANYALQPFEAPSGPQDVINGSGFHVRGQYRLITPGTVVTHPNGPFFDVDKIFIGELESFNSAGAGGLDSEEVAP